jgi:hypothetical protein
MVLKLTPANMNWLELNMIRIERTGFIGLLNCVVMSFLEIKSLTLCKCERMSSLYLSPLLTFIRFGFVGRQLLPIL